MAKQKRDAKATKAKIVHNSMLLFSQKGFDATTVDDIAKQSKINKAMIYYYYKNKARLYETIMAQLFSEIYTTIVKADTTCKTASCSLKMFIKTYSLYCEKHPYLPTLMLRELSNGGKGLPNMMFLGMRELFALLSEILHKGEHEGNFKNVIPIVVHFMITGTLNLLFVTQNLREKAKTLDEKLDTCSACSMDEITEYVYEKIKLMLEVKDEKNLTDI